MDEAEGIVQGSCFQVHGFDSELTKEVDSHGRRKSTGTTSFRGDVQSLRSEVVDLRLVKELNSHYKVVVLGKICASFPPAGSHSR